MICKKCDTVLLDNPDFCPICGNQTKPQKRRKNPLKLLIKISDLFAIAMNAVNIYLVVTAAHYATNLSYGLWFAKERMYVLYPALIPTDIIFCILYLILPILTSLSHYFLKKLQRKGMLLTIGATYAIVLCSALYPIITQSITGIQSPVLYFCMIQITLYFIFITAFSAYLIKSKRFIY